MSETLSIGIIGDYDKARPSHRATNEALHHAAVRLSVAVDITWLSTRSFLKDNSRERLGSYNGIWIGPGSPYRSMSGALRGIRAAREMNIPLIGT